MAETDISVQTSQLVCTRISHDIIGNVGAVANAVELLEEGDLDFIDDIRSVLKVSSGVLAARLKFFRMAFGLANSNLDDIPGVTAVAEAYLQTLGSAGFPITLELELHTSEFSRIALLTIMILADVIVKGGRIEARETDSQFAAIIHSGHPLSAQKISGIKTVMQGSLPDNAAQYAPVVYLQNILNNKRKINIIEENTFGFVIR